MKLGIIARCDDRGLGIQTWEATRHLDPERVLVVIEPSSEAQGFQSHPERYPDATVVTWGADFDNEPLVRDWLDGLDVVYSAETLYDWRMADWARDQHVATVVHCNPEFYRPTNDCDAWWAPTDWRIEHLPEDTRVVPMPVALDRFPEPDPSCPPRILHVAGRIATGDRNGTRIVQALQDRFDITITAQTKTRGGPEANPVANYWDLYDGYGILLMPRRYGGLCLPVNEGCAAGLIPVMTDCSPNHRWPIVPMAATIGERLTSQAGRIYMHDVSVEAAALALTRLLEDDLDARRVESRQWALDNSWGNLIDVWLDELGRAADSRSRKRTTKPKKAAQPAPVARRRPMPPTTLVVPFTPGQPERDAAWEWLQERYAAFHPDIEIVTGTCDGPWSKGTAVADALTKATGDVLIVSDADILIPPDTLNEAIEAATDVPWVIPYYTVYRLNQERTAELLAGPPATPNITWRARPGLDRSPYEGLAGGGIVVLRRSAYEKAPIDPRFVGWGREDVAWGRALGTLVGDPLYITTDLWHLWHPPQTDWKRPSHDSEVLFTKYQEATGLPRIMQALVNQQEPEPAVPLDKPVTFANPSTGLMMRIGNRKIRFRDGLYTTTDPDEADVLRRHGSTEEVA